jgi:hypothetical protein
MKKLILSLMAVAVLSACSTAPTAQQAQAERQENSAKLIEKNIPDWFIKAEQSPNAYRAIGDGVSGSIAGALSNARINAFEGICQESGAVARSQAKSYREDTESKSTASNTVATRVFCPDINISGAVVEKQQIIRDGSRFHAFVLVSLDKNQSSDRQVKSNRAQEFKELDQINQEYQSRNQ